MAQLVDSNQKKLSMEEIIKIAVQNTKSEYTEEQVLGSVYKELTLPGSIIIQIGNTIFMVHRVEKGTNIALMRALNADVAQNYLENSEQFAKMAYNEYHIDTIVSQYTDPALSKIFAYVGRNKPENMGYMVHKLSDGKTYQAVANLGPARKAEK